MIESISFAYEIIKNNSMTENKKNRSVTLELEVIETIKFLAKKNDRSFSNYVNSVLKQHIEENKPKKYETNKDINII